MSFFDFLKPIGGAIASSFGGPLAGSLVSGGLNYLGASQQNEANLASARQQQEFQAQQAAISREWQGDENQLDRDFNRGEAGTARAFNKREARTARKWTSGQAGRARGFNAKQARLQRNFYKEMSSTAHQRQIADMRAAGINPILSGKYGGAASAPGGMASSSTPTGSSASANAASSKGGSAPGAGAGAMARMENVVAPATSSALAYRANRATVDQLNQQVKTASAEEGKIKADEQISREEVKNRRKMGNQIDAENNRIKQSQITDMARYTLFGKQGGEIDARIPTYGSQIGLHSAKSAEAAAHSGKLGAETRRLNIQEKMMMQVLKGIMTEGDIDESTYGEVLRWMGRLNPFSTTAKDLVPLIRGK